MSTAAETDKVFPCQRSGKPVPLGEPRCLEPAVYCRWRTACPVHVLQKEQRRRPPPSGD